MKELSIICAILAVGCAVFSWWNYYRVVKLNQIAEHKKVIMDSLIIDRVVYIKSGSRFKRIPPKDIIK